MVTKPCVGILLAGGRAQRMGGGDKALHQIGGATILARIIATMAPQCAGLVLNANGDPKRFATYGLPIVADNVPGLKGPLAGILAGLDWTAANRPDVDFAVSTPTDTPFLPPDLVARLEGARREKERPYRLCALGRRRAPDDCALAGLHPRRASPRARRRKTCARWSVSFNATASALLIGRLVRLIRSSTPTNRRTCSLPRRSWRGENNALGRIGSSRIILYPACVLLLSPMIGRGTGSRMGTTLGKVEIVSLDELKRGLAEDRLFSSTCGNHTSSPQAVSLAPR